MEKTYDALTIVGVKSSLSLNTCSTSITCCKSLLSDIYSLSLLELLRRKNCLLITALDALLSANRTKSARNGFTTLSLASSTTYSTFAAKGTFFFSWFPYVIVLKIAWPHRSSAEDTNYVLIASI